MLSTVKRGVLSCSAASGLVAHAGRLFVVADDDTSLEVYDQGPLRLRFRVPLVSDSLPETQRARKAAKPDFESLALLPDGRLLALGSGSTPQRTRAVILDRMGAENGRFDGQVVDASPLYTALAAELPALNIEGAAVSGDALYLLQRGNGRNGLNALIELDLRVCLDAVATGNPWTDRALRHIRTVALGSLEGVPLGFTDATPRSDGTLLFIAAAEGGGSTYDDGDCAGSVLGGLALDGTVQWMEPLDVRWKFEGLALDDARPGEAWLVADADDRTVPAPLYSVTLPR